MYLLLQIRSFSYGNIIESFCVCAKCGTESIFDLPLNELKMAYLLARIKEEDYKDGVFNITLPKSGDILTLKLLTGEDIKDIRKTLELIEIGAGERASVEDSVVVYRFLLPIQKMVTLVNNKNLNTTEKEKYLLSLIGMDSSCLIDYLEFSSGDDISFYIICPVCR